MVMTFTGTPASFVCLTDFRVVCVRARAFMWVSIWHKGYGLSYRGDRWYVYRRMFAFCMIFNYMVCVCHRLCIYVYVRKCVWMPSYLCVTGCVCERVTAVYQSPRIYSLPSSLSFLCLKNPFYFIHFFSSWEVVQSKSKLVLSTVYCYCNTAQINILELFTKQTCSYTILPPTPGQ